MTSLDVLFNKKQCSCLAAEWDCPLAHPRRVLPANGSLQPRGSPHRPPQGLWSNGDLQGDDLPGTTVQGAGPSHSL